MGDVKAAFEELLSLARTTFGAESAGLLVRAAHLVAESDPEKALQCWQDALVKDPDCAGALHALADHHERRGEWMRLLSALNQLITIVKERDPQAARDAFHRKGVVLLDKLGSPEKAEQHFRLALGVDPAHVPSLLRLVRLANETDKKALLEKLSELGVAEARVRLAASAAAPVGGWEIPSPSPAPAVRRRVLVIDPDARVAEAFHAALAEHEVLVASSAVEARALLRSRSVDAIVCEAAMPELPRAEMLARAPVVLTAARPDDGDAERAFAAGVRRYLPKPVDAATIRAAVALATAGAPRREEPEPAPSPASEPSPPIPPAGASLWPAALVIAGLGAVVALRFTMPDLFARPAPPADEEETLVAAEETVRPDATPAATATVAFSTDTATPTPRVTAHVARATPKATATIVALATPAATATATATPAPTATVAATILAVIATQTPAPVRTIATPDPRAGAFDAGNALLSAGHVDDAVRELKRSVKADESYADGHYYLATAFAMQGEDSKACSEFQRYVTLAPNGRFAATARANIANCE